MKIIKTEYKSIKYDNNNNQQKAEKMNSFGPRHYL
jgi:hypothetical protein